MKPTLFCVCRRRCKDRTSASRFCTRNEACGNRTDSSPTVDACDRHARTPHWRAKGCIQRSGAGGGDADIQWVANSFKEAREVFQGRPTRTPTARARLKTRSSMLQRMDVSNSFATHPNCAKFQPLQPWALGISSCTKNWQPAQVSSGVFFAPMPPPAFRRPARPGTGLVRYSRRSTPARHFCRPCAAGP